MNDEGEDLPARLERSGTEVERWLVEGARSDAPSISLQERILRASAGEALTSRDMENSRTGRAWWGGAALAAAAGVAGLWWTSRDDAKPMVAEPRAEPRLPSSPVVVPAPVPRRVEPATCETRVVADGSAAFIDDLEDRDGRLPLLEGRTGAWFVHNDETGQQWPRSGEVWRPERLLRNRGSGAVPSSSRWALHTRGTAFSKWGAAAGFTFLERGCYDASRYAGVRFWARGRGPVKIALQTFDVVPRNEGGACEAECYGNHYRRVELEPVGQEYEVRFDSLVQHDFGPRVDFDPTRLRAFLVVIDAVDSPFDFWIDDVSFVE